MADDDITELEFFEPTRVDGVHKGANGFPILMLKGVGNVVEETETTLGAVIDELHKADDDTKCDTCHGDGKIMGNNRKCPKCLGTGVKPKVGDTEKTLAEKASAPSGVPTPPAKDCPTCKGNGHIVPRVNEPAIDCPDCKGTGKDDHFPPDLMTQDAPDGKITVGDSRETVDKAEMSGKSINDLPDSAFAHIEPGGEKDDEGKTTPRSKRHFPVHDAAHARNALARASSSPFGDKAMPKIKAAAKKFGIDVSAKGVSDVVSGANPFLNGSTNTSTTDPNAKDESDSGPAPGTPEWEACDADMATAAATALLQAAELIRQFADREAIEVAAGEGNDVFDTWDAQAALSAVTSAVGIMATLAFHEGMAAQKSEGVAEKSGKRLSTKSVSALAAARDHLSALLGDDDPAKASDDDDASKSEKDILDMTPDELTELVAATVAKAVVETDRVSKVAMGQKPVDDQTDSVASAKTANGKSKKKKPMVAATADDLEDENGGAADDNGSTATAKRVLTPEEIEAKAAAKAAKSAAKEAKKAVREAAENARVTKALEESKAQAEQAVKALEERLATVEKMAVPGGPAKTRPQEAVVKAAERDRVEMEIDRLERVAKETNDKDVRVGNLERVRELRAQLKADAK